MFLWLSNTFRGEFGALNVFRYVTFRSIGAAVTALVIALVLYPRFIKLLQVKQIGQVVRDDGPEAHLSKRGTPTMGGVLLLLAMLLAVGLWTDLSNVFVWLTCAITALYGVVGFVDDWLKIRDKNSKGVSERQKLVTQFGGALLVFGAMYFGLLGKDLADTHLYLPFASTHHFAIDIGPFLYIPFAALVVFATSTTVNFTDGQDGLVSVPAAVSATTFGVLCYLTGAKFGNFEVAKYLLIPEVKGVQELAVVCSALVGATLAFLWYNAYPALVFMGDVGALALGGALGMVAVLSKNELLSLVVNGVFVAEGASVVLQRYYYRRTKKRLFRMAPLHHHYQKANMPESRITVRFWLVSVMLSLVALASLKLR
ncbi:MAG: phospho-N-acetylmuramoyl-pentapeptide-transferase [Deltaproteobacteria bacterium]|nr:phospho-N-acetylmuramoyl-pentapeptide-transferase [Deltaproteobacteria bacterium]